jgi:glycosyltransferase involved in cell wall biosynthesis
MLYAADSPCDTIVAPAKARRWSHHSHGGERVRRSFHLIPTTYGSLPAIAREVVELERAAGWEVRTLGVGPSPWEANPWNLLDDCLAARSSWDPLTQWRIHRTLFDERPDRIHAWGAEATRYAVASPQAKRAEVRATLHASAQPLARRPWRALLPRVDRWCVGRESIRSELECAGAPDARIVSSPLGVREVDPAAKSDGDGWRPPRDGRFYLATSGRWTSSKQLKELLWAMCVFENVADCVLVVIGDGPRWRMLERYARLVLQKDSSRFLSWRPDARQVVARCSLYWPAGHRDQIDLAMLEAMADGVPVVAEDSATHRQLIRHRESGLLSLPGRGVERTRLSKELFERPAWGEQLGAAGRRAALDQFPLARTLAGYRDPPARLRVA